MGVKPTLTIMVGLPASGKSTYAKNNFKNSLILSSDTIREELFEGRYSREENEIVFNTLFTRMQEALNLFKDVVIDATNVTYKSRSNIFNRIRNIKCNVNAIVMGTTIENCLERNEQRESKVPEEVIKRMYHYYQHPQYFEGFKDIKIISSLDFHNSYNYFMGVKGAMKGFDQQNKHHKHTLEEHCNLTKGYLAKALIKKGKPLDKVLLLSGKLHDIGKTITKEWSEEKQNTIYYNHHNVGTYDLVSCFPYFSGIDWSIQDFNELLFYINYHMLPYDLKEEKTIIKYRERFGETLFNNLMELHKADKKAH